MEGVHGVDVSWLHHSQKGHDSNRKDGIERTVSKTSTNDSNAVSDHSVALEKQKSLPPLPVYSTDSSQTHLTSPPPALSEKQTPTRPLGRKNSWISSLSSKFSSSANQPAPATPPTATKHNAPTNTTVGLTPAAPVPAQAKKSDNSPPASASPKSASPGFLQSALRRLSSSGGGMGKASGNGAIVPRKIMNIDPYRERCSISELQPGKLRRVSFCVDVEIAGHAAPLEDEGVPPPTPSKLPHSEFDKEQHSKNASDKVRVKDKAEGEALKHPQAVEDAKEKTKSIEVTEQTLPTTANPALQAESKAADSDKPPSTRKKEKKKRSEEERKERKERKRQAALANGQIPMELTRDQSSSESQSGASTPRRPQDRPTIDPLRIYKRCCQLRETPALRKVAEQLAAPGVCDELHPGTVTCLYLSGSRFEMADIIALGDYLAVVPVRKLMIEDCGLTDETIRIILAGLLAVKTPAQAKFNKELPRSPGEKMPKPEDKRERLGVIEKISIKNNPMIGPDGWRHIACFINMSRTLKAIDLSMIPFPSPNNVARPARPQQTNGHKATPTPPIDVGLLFEKCLRERKGVRLEELVLAECGLESAYMNQIVQACHACGVSRLGLASNNMTRDSIVVVADYLRSGQCEGLDLGGNNLTEDLLDALIKALEESKPKFCALSVADTGLTAALLKPLLPVLAQLPDFRFIDLSHNRKLFAEEPNATALLRRWLPKMSMLKRVNLNDVAMEPEQCISLAEVLPEIPVLANLSILDNPALKALASANDEESREEACALYSSLMAATRVSKTIVSVDIDVPTPESGEIVQALAKQLVAYSLRNLERNLAIADDKEYEERAVHLPEILLHIIGHDDATGDTENEEAPDNDYIVGGTGIAKALTVCLGNRMAQDGHRHSLATPPGSGSATPTHGTSSEPRSKAMSVNLLANARKIRARLQPAIVNEEASGDEMAFRRLKALDNTLAGIIQRFEDEYPETRVPSSRDYSESGPPNLHGTTFSNPFEGDDEADIDEEDEATALQPPGRLSRHGSEVNLAAKHLTEEEGHMHRFGQKLRRDLLRPQNQDSQWGPTDLENEPDYLLRLRAKLEQLSGDEIKAEIVERGFEHVANALGRDADQLKELAEADPVAWKQLQTAHGNAYSATNVGGAPEQAVED